MTRVLVVGDTIVDENIYCDASGLSLETPTMKANFKSCDALLGGASNLASQLAKLGVQVDFFSSCTEKYLPFLEGASFNFVGFTSDFKSVKTRFWLSRGGEKYKYFQLNTLTEFSNEDDILKKLSESVTLTAYDKVIVSDYRLGLINKNLCDYVAMNSNFSIGASQLSDNDPNYGWFDDFNLIVCNEQEAKFVKRTNGVCVTLGEAGCMLNGKTYRAQKINAKNVIGAGDAFLAGFCASDGDPDFANSHAAKYLEELNAKY